MTLLIVFLILQSVYQSLPNYD